MCSYKSWFYDDNGYVIQCQSCKHFQVGFASIMLTLDEANFQTFVRVVFATKAEHVPVAMPCLKCIVLPTPSSCVNVLLTQPEFQQLYLMIEEVDTEIKVAQLLHLFKPENLQ
jgi:hypothetical protein